MQLIHRLLLCLSLLLGLRAAAFAKQDQYFVDGLVVFTPTSLVVDSIVVYEERNGLAPNKSLYYGTIYPGEGNMSYQFLIKRHVCIVSPTLPYTYRIQDTLKTRDVFNYVFYRYCGTTSERLVIRLDSARLGARYQLGEIPFYTGRYDFSDSMFVKLGGNTKALAANGLQQACKWKQAEMTAFLSSAIPATVAQQQWIPYDDPGFYHFASGKRQVKRVIVYNTYGSNMYMPTMERPKLSDYPSRIELRKLWITDDSSQYRAEFAYDQGGCIDTAGHYNFFRWEDVYEDETVGEVMATSGKQILTKTIDKQLYVFRYFWKPEYLHPTTEKHTVFGVDPVSYLRMTYDQYDSDPGLLDVQRPLIEVQPCEPFQVIGTFSAGRDHAIQLAVDSVLGVAYEAKLFPPELFPGRAIFYQRGGYPFADGKAHDVGLDSAWLARGGKLSWGLGYYGAHSPTLVSSTVDDPRLEVSFPAEKLEYGKAYSLQLIFPPGKFSIPQNGSTTVHIKLQFDQGLHYELEFTMRDWVPDK